MGGCLSDHFDEPADATPLEPEEREGLLQTWITYRRDLNEAEQTNIAAGTAWAWHVRRRDLLSEKFLRQLHKRLFGDVWAWAGEFRRTERNIGIDPVRIPVELRTAFDDARYWIEHEIFPPDEFAGDEGAGAKCIDVLAQSFKRIHCSCVGVGTDRRDMKY